MEIYRSGEKKHTYPEKDAYIYKRKKNIHTYTQWAICYIGIHFCYKRFLFLDARIQYTLSALFFFTFKSSNNNNKLHVMFIIPDH